MTDLPSTGVAPVRSTLLEPTGSMIPDADPTRTSGTTIQSGATLTWADRRLYREGAPHRILSGALHYFRVHPDLWRDRVRRLADLGLNTVDTYVPWNFHQPHEQRAPRFDGWRDLERFLTVVGEEGLDAIVRPGPYICAEWSNGGLPSWLTARGVALRSSDPGFTGPVGSWFDELVPRVRDLQANRGGPVVALQVENEFGSYGDDHAYLLWNREALVSRGIDELLFTADGPTDLMLDGGSVPGTLAAVTMGSRPAAARRLQADRRPEEPFVVAEYWNGWFDHWGEPHHVRSVASATSTLSGILDDHGSVSVYMAHGGTNFGLWAGANELDGVLQPTVTSYDSDAPIAEDGTLTPKFHAMRAELGVDGSVPLRVAAQPSHLPPRTIALQRRADLLPGLRAVGERSVFRPLPAAYEDLGLDAGLVVHVAFPRIPAGVHELTLTEVRDRAVVLVDGAPVGVVDGPSGSVTVTGTGDAIRLEVVVESLGRVNYGPLLGGRKGLLGPVLVDRRMVQGWESVAVPLQDLGPDQLDAATSAPVTRATTAPASGFATATLDVDEPADTFLALPGSTKGFVWVNGFLLGRYWEIGPQVTLYCPAPLLRPGTNTVTVLDLERLGTVLELRDGPELGPAEEYVEEF
ncbi:glycoside hydrolase family 35 protein [Curtobacterium sp. MCBD17_028]|uniref:glycoside hydrolase family 35 protein n=1 Tax=Curtobacterium sp. MCBD17_028 TaxID=2175670 RepID=UPI0021AC2C09|nr:glycoside hydrolase family 35 protein [Curtobacterium sp. MCBD17_028]